MAIFFMFGKYSPESIKEMSIERTNRIIQEIKDLGGEMTAMHAMLGEYDLLFCVQLPDISDAMKASVSITRLTGISFNTCPAVTVETFDRIVIES